MHTSFLSVHKRDELFTFIILFPSILNTLHTEMLLFKKSGGDWEMKRLGMTAKW